MQDYLHKREKHCLYMKLTFLHFLGLINMSSVVVKKNVLKTAVFKNYS